MNIDISNISNLSEAELDKKVEDLGVKCLSDGVPLSAVSGYSQEEMDATHNIAYNLYQQGKYQEAKNLFAFLALYDHFEKHYWIGLGGCYQMLNDYDRALVAYTAATYMDPSDPTPAFHAGECYLAQEDWDNVRKVVAGIQAIKNLEMNGDGEYDQIFQRAEALEQRIPA